MWLILNKRTYSESIDLSRDLTSATRLSRVGLLTRLCTTLVGEIHIRDIEPERENSP